MLRVWVPADDDRRALDTAQLRGSVCHVATGTEVRFSEDRALLELLHAAVARPVGPTARPEADPNPT